MSPFCSKCGNEISENSAFCQKCGNQIGTTANIESNNVKIPDFMFMNVFILIILTIVTFGFYTYYWLKRQEAGYKAVNKDYKLNMPLFVIMLVLDIIILIAEVSTAGTTGFLEILVYVIFLTISLDIATKINIKQSNKLSKVAIFFLGNWYLQYRINKDYK